MIKFISLVINVKNDYWVKTDSNINLLDVFKNNAVNTTRLMRISDGDHEYLIDINHLFTDNVIPTEISTLGDLVESYLTPEMIYSYHVDAFNFSKYIRCFSNADLPNSLVINAYNIDADEVSNIPDDPGHNDLRLLSEGYNLNKVIPIIDGKLKYCMWADSKIFIEGGAKLASADKFDFLSFGEANIVELVKLSTVRDNDWDVGTDKIPMLVLDGKLFYNESWIYSHNKRTGKLKLNQLMISTDKVLGKFTLDELITNEDSFVILVGCNAIYTSRIRLIPMGKDVFLFNSIDGSNHMSYVCKDENDYSVKSFTIVDEKYRNVSTDKDPMEHHIYIGNNSGDVSLTQLTIC